MTWVTHARTLARKIIHPASRWHSAIAEVPLGQQRLQSSGGEHVCAAMLLRNRQV